MPMQRGLSRRCPAFGVQKPKMHGLQVSRRVQLRLRPAREPLLLPGAGRPSWHLGLQPDRLSATPNMHDAHHIPPVPASWRPPRQPAPSTNQYASSPISTAATWGSDASFVAATKLQQQQYVRHVQQQPQDLPGSRPQPQRPGQAEARHRGKKSSQPTNQEPVFSYQQLFSQEMTPTANAANGAKQPGQQPPLQQSAKGFGKSKPRRAGSTAASASSTASGSAPAQPKAAAATPGAAQVRLCITRHVEYGQSMRATGSSDKLGAWDSDKGPKLKWHEGHKWSADVTLPPGSYEFKFMLEHRSGHLEWEAGSNRSFTVPKTAAEMLVEGHWGSTEDTEVLELQQQAVYRQQMQQLQQQEEALEAAEREQEATARAEAAAFAAANKAAAAAYQQQAEAAAAAAEKPVAASPVTVGGLSAADMFKVDLSLLDSDMPGHQQLMQVLVGFRQDMIEGLSGVTNTMQEIQEDLSQVQQQMSRLSAERLLEAQALVGPADTATGEAGAAAAGPAGPGGLTAATAAIIAADAAVTQEQALSGLQGVVQTWQQELVSFKQDSLDLRLELEQLRVSLESQMAENTAAVHDLEQLVKQLMGMEPSTAPPRTSPVIAAAAVAPAAPPPTDLTGRPSSSSPGPAGNGPPGSSELLDPEDKMLLDRINHLASDLSAEMKEAVQELELQQQSLFERHQHIIADMSISSSNNNNNRMALDLGYGAGLGMRMQPTNANVGVRGGSSSSSGTKPRVAGHVARAVTSWLESRNVQQYHQGLLVAVLVSCGLWRDSMWEQLEAGALRATYKAYKAVWSEACLQTWKDNITTKQALLTALSTGRQQLLSMHILWSLEELSTHSTQLQQLLPSVATPIELGLMQKLRQKGGAGQGWALGVTGAPVGGGEAAAAAQCAVLLQRWMSAADGT